MEKQKPTALTDGERDPHIRPLSDQKPYFHVVIRNSHLAKLFRMNIPHIVSKHLPVAKVPAKIEYRGKVWDLLYLGNKVTSNCRFENHSWEKFATANNLEVGDACVFELMEGRTDSTSIKFKVQVLKDKFPTELLDKVEGFKADNPISID